MTQGRQHANIAIDSVASYANRMRVRLDDCVWTYQTQHLTSRNGTMWYYRRMAVRPKGISSSNLQICLFNLNYLFDFVVQEPRRKVQAVSTLLTDIMFWAQLSNHKLTAAQQCPGAFRVKQLAWCETIQYFLPLPHIALSIIQNQYSFSDVIRGWTAVFKGVRFTDSCVGSCHDTCTSVDSPRNWCSSHPCEWWTWLDLQGRTGRIV